MGHEKIEKLDSVAPGYLSCHFAVALAVGSGARVGPNVCRQAPNEAWVTDLTDVPTAEGWLYLAGVKDLYTCEVVGHAMDARMTTNFVGCTLMKALNTKRPAPGLIYHSARGSQYCAHDYQAQLRQFGLRASISRQGNCYDNAPMESFWGTSKNELVHHRRYETREQDRREISEYIELFYNR